MKRGDKSEQCLWVKTTPGTLIIRGPQRLRVKHKQKIKATVAELGKHVKEFELLEGTIDKTKNPDLDDTLTPVEKEEYTIDNLGAGWHDVLSPSGERMNTKRLRAADAAALKEELEAESE